MREISLNILDIAQNSISAKASLIEIGLRETNNILTVTIADNGKGMSPEQLEQVRDPFFTTRTTRKVGMGIPLFKMAAEMTGGSFDIQSSLGKGTIVTAVFRTDSIDFTPVGDMAATMCSLISMNTDIDFVYRRSVEEKEFTLDTKQMREILGDVPLSSPEVTEFITDFICENTTEITGGAENENP